MGADHVAFGKKLSSLERRMRSVVRVQDTWKEQTNGKKKKTGDKSKRKKRF
jgi:hypothetical protein